jgi:hypothetical protein
MKLFERIEAAPEKRNHFDLASCLRCFEMCFASLESERIQEQ